MKTPNEYVNEARSLFEHCRYCAMTTTMTPALSKCQDDYRESIKAIVDTLRERDKRIDELLDELAAKAASYWSLTP